MFIEAEVDLDIVAITLAREYNYTDTINFVLSIDDYVCDIDFTTKLIKKLQEGLQEGLRENNEAKQEKFNMKVTALIPEHMQLIDVVQMFKKIDMVLLYENGNFVAVPKDHPKANFEYEQFEEK